MIESELSDIRVKINMNRREINRLSKEQRTLKEEAGKLYELLRTLKVK